MSILPSLAPGRQTPAGVIAVPQQAVIEPGSQAYRLLYCDPTGEVIGLDEVQLWEPIPLERIAPLRELLQHNDPFVRYQAMLVLVAWADEQGLRQLERFINAGLPADANLAPDNISSEDNAFDQLAEAVKLAVSNGLDQQTAAGLYRKLLRHYGQQKFKSDLKYALLRHATPDLLDAIETALEDARRQGRIYQASQLLPVIAKLDPARGWRFVQTFLQAPRQVPDPANNVAEALGYIDSPAATTLLRGYLNHADGAVRGEAQRALSRQN